MRGLRKPKLSTFARANEEHALTNLWNAVLCAVDYAPTNFVVRTYVTVDLVNTIEDVTQTFVFS
jgi:hypothetical protein